jgi:Putative Ig domain
MPVLTDYIPAAQQFQIFWPCPIRAHVGVDIDFRFSWYELNNEQLIWSLENAPSWMTINTYTGLISGTPTTEATHAAITVSAKRSSGPISKTFDCTVDNSRFIFVSPDGDDSATGTQDNPYRTIAPAISQLSNSEGKTIYLRRGRYIEGYATQTSPFTGFSRIETDYQEIRGYPGEIAVWDFGGEGNGGFDFNIRYGVISNLYITNGARLSYPKLVTLSSEHTVIKDCILSHCDGANSNNLCGVEIKPSRAPESGSNILVDRTVICSCYQRTKPITDPSQDNAPAVDVFTNSGSSGTGDPNFWIWLLNGKSFDCGYGPKVKHSGLDRLIVQNWESHSNGRGNYHLGSPWLAMRHCVSLNTLGSKALICNADNNAAGPGWYERNTFVESGPPSTDYIVNVQGNTQSNGGTFKHNIFAATSGDSRTLFRLWEDEPDWTKFDANIDRNLYYNDPDAGGFIVGGGDPKGSIDFAKWQTKTLCNGTKTLDPNGQKADPIFAVPAAGILDLPLSSPAATVHEDGSYIGALEPGKSYGMFGQTDTSLINFNINGSAPPPAPQPEPEPEPPARIGYSCACTCFGYRLAFRVSLTKI